MTNAEDFVKVMIDSDTREVTALLESLDDKSKVLAKTYLSALADRQLLEKSKLAAAV